MWKCYRLDECYEADERWMVSDRKSKEEEEEEVKEERETTAVTGIDKETQSSLSSYFEVGTVVPQSRDPFITPTDEPLENQPKTQKSQLIT